MRQIVRIPCYDSRWEIEALEKKADRLPSLETAIRKQHQELRTLRKKVLLLGLDEVAFENDDEKMLFYTGLPNLAVFNLVLK